MRVQPTRSSLSAPRSPLTRLASGGFARRRVSAAIGVGLGAVVMAGCVRYRGKNYWAWDTLPGWPVTSSCEQVGTARAASVEIAVLDETDGSLPGVAVKFRRLDAVGQFATETDPRGRVRSELEAGQWQIDVELAGFTHRSYTLTVGSDQACQVTFHLSLDSKSPIPVT